MKIWHVVVAVVSVIVVAISLTVTPLFRMTQRLVEQAHSATQDNGSHPEFPELLNPVRIEFVETYHLEITGTGPGLPMRVWVYLPAGRRIPHSLPCVFIAPAGSRLLHGMNLAGGDIPEHLPYAAAGFVTVAYELSGPVPASDSITFGQLADPVREFMAAQGGVTNARLAVDFALAKLLMVDPERLYAAGHSSAGTMALNAAVADHRIRAVAAYAPCCDVIGHWQRGLAKLERVVPGVTSFARRVSPMEHVGDIQCPILLFHADDDSNVLTADNAAYAQTLMSAGKVVTFRRVATGGHYQSMMDEGVSAGIAFFMSQGARAHRVGAMYSTAKSLPPVPLVQPPPRAEPSPPPFVTFHGDNYLSTAGPAWIPEPYEETLATQDVVIKGYAFRPPLGSIRLLDGDGNTWLGKAAALMHMSVSIQPRLDSSLYPSVNTGGQSLRQGHQSITMMPGTKECGSLDGIPFIRAFRNEGGKTYIVYAAFDGQNMITIDGRTNDQASLETIEASARTFHKVK